MATIVTILATDKVGDSRSVINNNFANLNTASVANSQSQISLNVNGVLDTASATALATLALHPLLWRLPNATLQSVNAKVLTAVSGGAAPTIMVVQNSVNAMSSALSVNETWAAGTIDAANDDIDTGQTLEINLTVGNADAENLIIELVYILR